MLYREALKTINEKKIERTIKALKNNNIDARLFNSAEELIAAIKEMVPADACTAMGGSATIGQIDGLTELIKSYDFKDRKKPAETKEEQRKVKMEANFVDYYFMSSNAITVDGQLYNVDGTGNRVSALIYGPDHVIVIATPRKIVPNVEAATERVEEIAAPANCEKMKLDTPCRKLGSCADCRSKERICIFYTLTGYQKNPDRIKVFFLNEDLGL